jgi:hypothetical protein
MLAAGLTPTMIGNHGDQNLPLKILAANEGRTQTYRRWEVVC